MNKTATSTTSRWATLFMRAVAVVLLVRMAAELLGKHDDAAIDVQELIDERAATSGQRRSPGARLGLSLLACSLFGLLSSAMTWAAFSDTSANSGNSFVAGTVDIDDNDNDTAMLGLTNAKPGDSDTSCIKVTFNGTLDSAVRLYGTTTGTGLDAYLDLTVTRGTYSAPEPAFDSCTNFAADATDYIGAGAGVVYNGTLQAFGDDFSTGLVDPVASAPEVWTTAESHVYRFVVTLRNDNLAQGKDATQTFTWESRNN